MPPTRPTLSATHAEMLVLASLAEAPSYGYAITRAIDARSQGDFAIGPAKLYPLLAKLDKQGLVTTSWEEVKAENAADDAKGRRRKWYTISPKGTQRLAQLAEAHRRFTSLVDAFLPSAATQNISKGARA